MGWFVTYGYRCGLEDKEFEKILEIPPVWKCHEKSSKTKTTVQIFLIGIDPGMLFKTKQCHLTICSQIFLAIHIAYSKF